MKTFKKIVVSTDFSDTSKSAYHYAQQLAQRFGASIEVVHFVDVPVNPINSNALSAVALLEDLEVAANLRLARFVNEINETENDADTTLVVHQMPTSYTAKVGFAADELIALSKDPSVDLLILGTTGNHGLLDKIFGSIAVKVSREAYCPVLLVPHGAVYRRIHNMVYTASFESSEPRDIKLALDFAKYFVSALHFVHVVVQPDDLGLVDKMFFKRLLNSEHTNVPYSISNIHAFTPAEGIYQYIVNNDADLVVTVTKHRSFWEKLVHPSTTKSLAWHAQLPLLVLHQEDKIQPPHET